MQKTLEQDYVISGDTEILYGPLNNQPYFSSFDEYESGTITGRYHLPMWLLVTYFLRSIGKQQKEFSLRINKIVCIHSQPRDSPVVRVPFIGDTYMTKLPLTSIDLQMGVLHTLDTQIPIYNLIPDYGMAFKDINQKFFQFYSEDDRYEWDFTKGTYPSGYGTFIKYKYLNLPLNGSLVPRGFYISLNTFSYRTVKILLSITIRDEI